MSTPSPVVAEPGPSRLQALDGLRGIAAIIVLMFHYEQSHGSRSLFASGYLAVDFFFLLSGFVLVGPIEGRGSARNPGGMAILAARFLRFWPLMALGAAIGAGVQFLRWPADQVLPLLALAWLSIPLAWNAGHAFALYGPQWSLFVELLYNAAHIVLFRKLKAHALLAISLICGIVLAWGEHRLSMLTTGADYDDILIGLVRAGFAYPLGIVIGRQRHLLDQLPLTAAWIAPALLVATIVLPAVLGITGGASETFARLAFVIVLVIAVRSRPSMDAARTMTWLGAISFPLYAVHVPILALADKAGRAVPAVWSAPIFLGGLLVSLVLAHLLARSWLARGISMPAPTARAARFPRTVTQSD